MKKVLCIYILLLLACKAPQQYQESTLCDYNEIEFTSKDSTILKYKIDYSIRNEFDDLYRENGLWFAVESLPLRTAKVYDKFEFSSEDFHENQISIPTISNQDSLVISFWFKGRGNSPIEHAVYYKIKVNHGSITTFYKKITEEDIWDKPNCRFYTVFSKEPEFGIHTCVTSNVVGSPENFIIFDLPKNKKKFDKKVKLLERHWRNRFEEFKSSTPCGEIYFNIY